MIAYVFGSDWIWVLLVVVVLFGGSQLPKLAKNAGDAMKEFRKAHDEASDAAQTVAGHSPAPQALAPPAIAPAVPSATQPVASAPQQVLGAPVAPYVASTAAPVANAAEVPDAKADQVTLSRDELDALITVARQRAAAQKGDQPQA